MHHCHRGWVINPVSDDNIYIFISVCLFTHKVILLVYCQVVFSVVNCTEYRFGIHALMQSSQDNVQFMCDFIFSV